MADTASYVGRFAPSPTGPLHFGSLLSALTGYLDARYNNGTWLVRIEDIDPPREVPGTRTAILNVLRSHGLHWDGQVRIQSENRERHRHIKERWLACEKAYYCRCARKDLRQHGGDYPGYCRDLGLGPDPDHAAVRLRVQNQPIAFTDRLWGQCDVHLRAIFDDFLIWRKNDWPAYHLALVLDDFDAGITHVVRGCDLKTQTFRQIYLYQLLGYEPPCYCHHPVVVHPEGSKLSKQTFAKPVDTNDPITNIKAALKVLNQPIPQSDRVETLLALAVQNWQITRIPQVETLPEQP